MSNYALRLPESLKQAAKRIAAADDTTMNQFFVVAIAEKISAMETAQFSRNGQPRLIRRRHKRLGTRLATRRRLPTTTGPSRSGSARPKVSIPSPVGV